jgi:hypothetical protein
MFADDDGEVHADETERKSEETWLLYRLNNGRFALKCQENDSWLCAENDANFIVNCNRKGLGPWEQWEMLKVWILHST